MKTIACLLFSILILSYPSFSQQITGDSTIVSAQLKESKSLYINYMGPQAAIYNGRQYVPYRFLMEGHPYYGIDTISNGWISYGGRIYENIPVQFDVSRDQLIIASLEDGSKIFLQNELVDSFHFFNHTFKRLAKDPQVNIESTGFYDLLYRGSVEVFALRKKNYLESFQSGKIVRIFNSHDLFYILKNGHYYLVKNEKDVFEILGGKRNEIKKLLRQNDVKFRRTKFEKPLVMATTFFDQLKN